MAFEAGEWLLALAPDDGRQPKYPSPLPALPLLVATEPLVVVVVVDAVDAWRRSPLRWWLAP